MSAVAGWYADPHASNQLRYWDGIQWTQHIAPRDSQQQRAADPQSGFVQADGAYRSFADASSAKDTSTPVENGRHRGNSTSRKTERQKVPIFGAKKYAEALAQENQELQAAIEEYGLNDVVIADRRRHDLLSQVGDEQRKLDALIGQQELVSLEIQRLSASIIEMRGKVELQELGVYDYEHPAESSLELGTELEQLRSLIKQAVRAGDATIAASNFTFNNSQAKGRRFVKDMSKLLLRAYNAEAENCVKAVRAGNLGTAQKRLSTVVDQIARQGALIELRIAPHYHAKRLKELEIAARHLQSVQRGKELERERRAELREQRKVEQELKREQEKLTKERTQYLSTIAALEANGDLDGVERMRARLADVDAAIANVDYRAANIRAGYVYVISNVGAFGPGVVKIGMTRRLEPMDRVRELGDASVPFRFDVHALFFAQDAVAVESALHRHFAASRINKVNLRREFFRVTPQDVLDAIREERIEVVEFTLEAVGEEYLASR